MWAVKWVRASASQTSLPITSFGVHNGPAGVASYNNTIVSAASQLSTSTSPIAVAQEGADINVAADLWDGMHPNAHGETKIAAGFADALAAQFHLGAAYPTPSGPADRPADAAAMTQTQHAQ